ncbi:MAG: DHHW family protein, partial [Coriobacteriales bacterium]|nr:DHHW family protein [Coriobacteriales bacterium]
PQIEPQNDNFATHHNQAESTLDFEKLDEIENSSEYSSVTNRKLSNARSVNTSGERPPRRTKRKRHGTVVGITFLSLIAVLLVTSILIPDSNFSETENRPLQEFPTISLDSYLSGTLQDDYQTYVEDQFPLRNLWVTINTFVMQLTGRIENNGVYHCSDSSLIQKFTKPSDNTPVDAILKFKAEHQDLKTYALIAPTAAGINEDKIPDYALPSNQKEYLDTINSQFKQAGITPIELWDTFMDNKDDQIYYKFDHHWTSQGAYLAYLQCASQMGITEATDKKYEDMLVSNTFQGSLASEGGYLLSGTEELHIFMRSDVETPSFVTYVEDKDKQISPFVSSALDKKDAYQVFFGGNHPLIQIDNYSNAKRGTLLIIKDSYANCFIPFMIGDFDKILVVDPRYYTGNLNDLISSNSVINVLFCYNATTFSEDTSLSRMINAPAQTPTEAKEDVEAKLQEEANALLNN